MALEADASGDDVARGRDAAGDGNVPGDSNIADDGDVSRDLRVSENFDAVLLDDEVDGAGRLLLALPGRMPPMNMASVAE